ncbi:MAG: ATPase [Thermodesulfobacteriota bacterium]
MSGSTFVFLTTPDALPGFGLAGFRQQGVAVAEAEPVLRAILAEEAPQLVVVDERLLAGIDPERFLEMGQRYAGALAVLPGPGRMRDGEPDYAEQLIGRAIGYRLRLAAEEPH